MAFSFKPPGPTTSVLIALTEVRRADEVHRRDAVGPLRILAEEGADHQAAHAMAHEDEFGLRRRDAGLLFVKARVVVELLGEQRRGDRGDFLPPIVGEGEKVGAIRVGMKPGRVLLLGHTVDELAVDIDRARRDHRARVERIGHAQREIELRRANGLQASPDARGIVFLGQKIGIVELRPLVGGHEDEHLRMERAIGARARTKKEHHCQYQARDEPVLHAMWADLEPGTSASDCSSA
jgi:hypothetical protein